MTSARCGAFWAPDATSFELFSAHAQAVELCLFGHPGAIAPQRRLALERRTEGIWSLKVEGVAPGQLYGYRVHGPFDPHQGHFFNSAKLLVDPWALAITGEPVLGPEIFGFREHEAPTHSFEGSDSAALMPKSIVVDPSFDWQGTSRPRIPWRETFIYEAHVKGLSFRHPEIPAEARGRYAGLAHEAILDHWRRLGVTTIELMPCFQIASEPHLQRQGLRNYWGYSPLGFFAPHAGYASNAAGGQVREFQEMVRSLHRAGFEVILDGVYNHTAEGGAHGPILALKGVDNASYYRLDRRSRYVDWTGCGNTLDLGRAPAQELVLASLRFWAEVMGVDGFRLDLAPLLFRGPQALGGVFEKNAPLARAIAEDPLLASLKWIAEPWDLGPNGYRLGQFPEFFAEWNDRFRDSARRAWLRPQQHDDEELRQRLAGSPDLFGGRTNKSINFVCSHDGSTLADLVSYKKKHNERNGENNRDGSNHELCNNFGFEGPTDLPKIKRARERARDGLLATLLQAEGVPMLGHGDELGRTQQGNNNAYCQDNELAWVDWSQPDEKTIDRIGRWARRRRLRPSAARQTP